MRKTLDPKQRLASKCRRTQTGCLEWTGYVFPNRYGQFLLRGVRMPAHRAAWILAHGPVADGLCVCHRCDNRKCVNVEHLFLGTYQDNADDMVAKGRWTPRIPNRGVKVNTAKLTEDDVREMRRLCGLGWSYKDLAAKFGVGHTSVRKTCIRLYWKHVA